MQPPFQKGDQHSDKNDWFNPKLTSHRSLHNTDYTPYQDATEKKDTFLSKVSSRFAKIYNKLKTIIGFTSPPSPEDFILRPASPCKTKLSVIDSNTFPTRITDIDFSPLSKVLQGQSKALVRAIDIQPPVTNTNPKSARSLDKTSDRTDQKPATKKTKLNAVTVASFYRLLSERKKSCLSLDQRLKITLPQDMKRPKPIKVDNSVQRKQSKASGPEDEKPSKKRKTMEVDARQRSPIFQEGGIEKLMAPDLKKNKLSVRNDDLPQGKFTISLRTNVPHKTESGFVNPRRSDVRESTFKPNILPLSQIHEEKALETSLSQICFNESFSNKKEMKDKECQTELNASSASEKHLLNFEAELSSLTLNEPLQQPPGELPNSSMIKSLVSTSELDSTKELAAAAPKRVFDFLQPYEKMQPVTESMISASNQTALPHSNAFLKSENTRFGILSLVGNYSSNKTLNNFNRSLKSVSNMDLFNSSPGSLFSPAATAPASDFVADNGLFCNANAMQRNLMNKNGNAPYPLFSDLNNAPQLFNQQAPHLTSQLFGNDRMEVENCDNNSSFQQQPNFVNDSNMNFMNTPSFMRAPCQAFPPQRQYAVLSNNLFGSNIIPPAQFAFGNNNNNNPNQSLFANNVINNNMANMTQTVKRNSSMNQGAMTFMNNKKTIQDAQNFLGLGGNAGGNSNGGEANISGRVYRRIVNPFKKSKERAF